MNTLTNTPTNTATSKLQDTLHRIKRYDEQRPGFPGEHLLVLAAGLGVWIASRRAPSLLVRAAGRAASGRDGLRKVLRLLPVGRGLR